MEYGGRSKTFGTQLLLKSSFSSLKYSGSKISSNSNLSSDLHLKTLDWPRNTQIIDLIVLDQVTILDFQSRAKLDKDAICGLLYFGLGNFNCFCL